MSAYAHSYTRVDRSDQWRAFRAASEGGGSPPEWTQQSAEDDPTAWSPPLDASGSLWIRRDADDHQVPGVIAYAAGVLEWRLADVVAAYFSSGGQAVLLFAVEDDPENSWIVVVRAEPDPRLGCRERNVVREFPDATPQLYGSGISLA